MPPRMEIVLRPERKRERETIETIEHKWIEMSKTNIANKECKLNFKPE